ncbi:unnamed protein product [Brassicogethes aeneus]|uniref:Facilitated trehalose transporter Tret1-like n=1 Tax=Brassicogethes aeneus TaxID=1431903 RepID=A0A9P0FNR2_BRAAE|nr:unnamed protein product [Brassicogethes aeneus]
MGFYIYFVALIANFLLFEVGSTLSWTSPVFPKLTGTDNPLSRPITTDERSIIAGIPNIGAAIGPFVTGKIADRFGRKVTLLCVAVPYVISFVALAFAQNVCIFYVARFIQGVALGCTLQIVSMYFGEITEKSNRGRISSSLAIFSGLGVLFCYLFGPYLSIRLFSLIFAIPAGLVIVLYTFIPESPLYLANKGDRSGAEKSLMKLRSKSASEVAEELSELMRFCEKSQCKGTLKDVFTSRGLMKAFYISLGVLQITPLVGIGPILAYMQTIFDSAGGAIPSHLGSILVSIIKVLSCLLTSIIVEKTGKKVLLLISSVGVFLALTGLSTFFFLQTNGVDVSYISWIPVTSLILYMTFFSIGVYPISWVIMGELFPSNVRSVASSLLTSLNFSASFLITIVFPYLEDSLGLGPAFLFFAGSGVLGGIFVYYCVFETNGKSLSEIQDLLNK